MKVFICLAALLALAQCAPQYKALLNSGLPAGPVHPATGPLVATSRGWKDANLEGFSEDDNQDGFVDPVGQVAPVVYHAAPVAAPVVTYAQPQHVVTYAQPQHVVTYAQPHYVATFAHAPLTYTHAVAGAPILSAPYFAGFHVAPAAAAAAEETVKEA